MSESAKAYPVQELCKVLGVSRSAYYAWRSGQSYRLKDSKAEISQRVKSVFEEHLGRYGTRRIQAELKDQGLLVGRDSGSKDLKRSSRAPLYPKRLKPIPICAAALIYFWAWSLFRKLIRFG